MTDASRAQLEEQAQMIDHVTIDASRIQNELNAMTSQLDASRVLIEEEGLPDRAEGEGLPGQYVDRCCERPATFTCSFQHAAESGQAQVIADQERLLRSVPAEPEPRPLRSGNNNNTLSMMQKIAAHIEEKASALIEEKASELNTKIHHINMSTDAASVQLPSPAALPHAAASGQAQVIADQARFLRIESQLNQSLDHYAAESSNTLSMMQQVATHVKTLPSSGSKDYLESAQTMMDSIVTLLAK